MDSSTTSATSHLRVLHLDHTVESGGAELALRRLIWGDVDWRPVVLVPNRSTPGLGVFENAPPLTRILSRGPAQSSGATTSRSIAKRLSFILSGVGQAVSIRLGREFRNAHIVHANTSRSALYGALACLGTRKKFIVHLRDLVTSESLGTIGHLLLTRVALRRADAVVANSHTTLASALPHLPTGTRRAVIASPIGFSAVDTPYIAVRQSPLRVGMVARIDPWKGHELLIRAFARAFPDGDEVLLLAGGAAFGKDWHLSELKRLAVDLGIEDRIDFVGHIDDVAAFIASLDVCVQCSTRPEPLGQNVLQYLASARPVIASNSGGPTEWIQSGYNGLLFETGNETALTESLRLLASDESLRERLAANAPASVEAVSDAHIRSQHAQLYSLVSARTPTTTKVN